MHRTLLLRNEVVGLSTLTTQRDYNRVGLKVTRRAIFREDAAIDVWAVDVPFLFPRFRGWTKPKHPFWVRRCIKREEKKVMYLISAVVLFDLAQHGFELSRLPENLTWYYVWAAVMLGYLMSRGLRRFTDTFEGVS
jgi:hypothetical protein